ncbi:hypothetical protein KVG29_08860 [Caldicoprobacter algeriensis]|uniref:hypothetical protein n=1 Tax=Caldicoprobacter algeriensis TaxID=699281 RepID=UPI002079ACC8|nr:hypothetical protein [Caldicoprobacter algeriensis]MCM8901329.1 hypothetical protein [Caldicoprobacter algeriensis]
MFAREFGWTLDEIKQLRPSELEAILKELSRQKEVESVADQYNHWAFLAAMIANAAAAICGTLARKKGKQYKPEDFIDKKVLSKIKTMPKETNQQDLPSLIEEAKAKGLKGPW